MSWIITPQQKHPVSPFLLDTYPGAAAAYSLRQLRTGVTNVVRVRRSSDNAELDFTAAQVTNGTLTGWVGAGNNGFVRTWYDQSGNGRDASQTTTSQQPEIVLNGALITEGLKPALSFNGISHSFNHNYSITTASTILAVAKLTAVASSVEPIYEATAPNTSLRNGMIGDANNSGQWGTYMNSWKLSGYSAQGTRRLMISISDGLTSGTVQNTLATNGAVTTVTDTGRYAGDALDRRSIMRTSLDFTRGVVQEIIVWPTAQTSSRVGIESNINGHYAIY
jgi:hypothetical protein